MPENPKGLRIEFKPEGAVLHLDQTVEGRWATTQAALVNVGTHRGTDFTYPERGTEIVKQAAEGLMVDFRTSQHYANFASLDTVFFIREHDQVDVDPITDLDLSVSDLTYQRLFLDVRTTFDSGNEIGTVTPL